MTQAVCRCVPLMPLGRHRVCLGADHQRAVPMVPKPVAALQPDWCLNPFLPFSRTLFVLPQRRSGCTECRKPSSSCPLLTTGQCCARSAELSPAAFQRAMMRFQVLPHTCNIMRLHAEAAEGCIRSIDWVSSLAQGHGWCSQWLRLCFAGLGTAAWCHWKRFIYFIFRDSSNDNH